MGCILMKTQADQLRIMSQTLESSGFSQRQSNAVIESVALAMETFAVTPEVLETRLARHTEQILSIVRAQGEDIKALQRDMGNLQANMLSIQTSMLNHQRSMFRIMVATMSILLATTLGLFGTLATQMPSP